MEIIKNMPLSEIMTSKPISVDPDTIMTEVSKIMESNNFHHLPVVNSNHEVVGVISEDELKSLEHHLTLLGKAYSEMSNVKLLKTLLASDVMTKEVVCLDHNDTLNDAIQWFLKNQFHSILITQENKLVGIITPYDIIKLLDKII